MSKWLICFLWIVLTASFTEAQDTIYFNTGEKDAVTVISFSKKTINFILEDTSYSVNPDRINFIKYRDGKKYSYQALAIKYDSIHKVANVELEEEDSANYRPIHISIGVGGSTLQADIINNDNIPAAYYGPYFLTLSPAYNFMIDYSFIRWLSFGVGAVYQYSTDNPSEQLQSNNNVINQNEIEKITRYNYSARLLYHPLKHSQLDVYAGVRVGESMWKEQITSNSNQAGSIIYITDIPSSSQVSFQVVAGAAMPVFHCIGFHLEIGVGNPYVFEAGISFMFKP